jgi:hypothetical protein
MREPGSTNQGLALALVAAVVCILTARSALAGRSAQQLATITSIREVNSAKVGGKAVEVTLTSDAPFIDENNQQLMLIIGGQHFTNHHYRHGDRRTIVFTIGRAAFDSLPDGSSVKVGFGLQRGTRWDAGVLNKSFLGRY